MIVMLVLEAWLVAAVLQLVLWLVQLRTKNAGIVDVGWAGAFALVVALFAWRAETSPAVWAPIAIVVIVWSVRLTGYLISRGAAGLREEGRYVDLRARWGTRAATPTAGCT
jgi:steroid 5-alpha reductase family enzyme